ncbi:expressed unknown protein [Seminavis robusta]|uniref:Tc1-like transposase DDE domain-containing protein n=1 Tax=Seminavis robusta TaxID=568900 RepID=A0A9N8HIB1_9STRA|nr:expressed unknown protein [Seminavis robusta]|eukprot:Sro770_g199930.1 n/a (214) ;mRNA; f:12186-12967
MYSLLSSFLLEALPLESIVIVQDNARSHSQIAAEYLPQARFSPQTSTSRWESLSKPCYDDTSPPSEKRMHPPHFPRRQASADDDMRSILADVMEPTTLADQKSNAMDPGVAKTSYPPRFPRRKSSTDDDLRSILAKIMEPITLADPKPSSMDPEVAGLACSPRFPRRQASADDDMKSILAKMEPNTLADPSMDSEVSAYKQQGTSMDEDACCL